MERVTITIEHELLAAFDQLTESKGYANRSEAMRDALRQWVADQEVALDDMAPCIGCVVYLYNHKERALSSRLVEAQHDHLEVPTATLHLHVDANDCLEATVLNGRVGEVRHLADHIIAQTGVRNGRLHLIPRRK